MSLAHSIYGDKQEFGLQRTDLLRGCETSLSDLRRDGQQFLARQSALERELTALRSFPAALFTCLSAEKRARRTALEEELHRLARKADRTNREIRKVKGRMHELQSEIKDNSPRVLCAAARKSLKLAPGRFQGLREDRRFFGHSLTEAYPVNLDVDYLGHSGDVDGVFRALRRRIAEADGNSGANRESLRRHVEHAGASADLGELIAAARNHLAVSRSCVEDQRRLESALEAFVMRDLLVWETPDLVAGASVLLSQNLFHALNDFAQRGGLELQVQTVNIPHELAWTSIRTVRVESRYAIREKILGQMVDCDVIEYTAHDSSGGRGGAIYDANLRAIYINCAEFSRGSGDSMHDQLLAAEYGFLPASELESQLRRSEFVGGAIDAVLQDACAPHESLASALPARLCRILASLIMSPLTKYEIARLDDLLHGSVLDELAAFWLRAAYSGRLGYALAFGDLTRHDFPELVAASKELLTRVLDAWHVDGHGSLYKELRHLAA
ncbi:MAG: hypothetical protein O2923_09440 [Verrucomicrobia bacterium]|nr:hypothetical protein [Verrucomicrobiota bacterium]